MLNRAACRGRVFAPQHLTAGKADVIYFPSFAGIPAFDGDANADGLYYATALHPGSLHVFGTNGFQHAIRGNWLRGLDLHQRPPRYERGALLTAPPRKNWTPRPGNEPDNLPAG